MARDPGPDDGREELYDDDGSAARASGVLVGHHRYALQHEQPSERELDRRAQMDAMQEMADQGRPVHGIPWWKKAREKAKVRHRQWEKRANGWSHCKRPGCGFPVPTTVDSLKIEHQEGHKEDDRIRGLMAGDMEHVLATLKDHQAQLNVAAEELSKDRYRLDALLLALGHAEPEALQAAVEDVLSYARQVNAAQAKARKDEADG